MKKLFTALLAFSCVFWTQMVSAQVSSYTFAQSSGQYLQAGIGASLTSPGSGKYDDNNFTAVTLPFTFTYCGTAYTTIGVSANGFARLGSTTSTSYNATSSQAAVLAPFNYDLDGNSSGTPQADITYTTFGNSGNRVFTIQWNHWGFYSAANNEISFQVKLYESNNRVQFCYQPNTPATSNGIAVGLTGPSGTGDFKTLTGTWAAPTAGGSNSTTMSFSSSAFPANGLTYTFASSTTAATMALTVGSKPYVAIQGATAATSVTTSNTTYDDNNFSPAATIPFTFTYAGTPFTTVGFSANGFAVLGGTTSTYYAVLAGGMANAIAAWNNDLDMRRNATDTTADISYYTVGTSPNREFVIQWTNDGFYSASLQEQSYQIRLKETTNLVTIVYGTCGTHSTSSSMQVGLTGATTSDFNVRTTTTNWAATTAAGSNSASCTHSSTVFAPDGQTYVWTPPSCTTPSAVSAGSITSSSASISFTCSACSGSYIVEYGLSGSITPGTAGTAGTGGTVVTGASSPITISGLSPNTTYQVYVRQNCGAGNYSTNSTVYSFTTLQTPCSGTPPTGTAGAYQSVAVTGFNADIVANGIGAVSTSTNSTVDGVFNFAAPDFQVTSGSALQTNFLPASRAVNSIATPGMIFNLQPYTGNNVLREAAGANGTLTLSSAKAATAVNLLYAVGNGPATCNITVTFSDATTQVFTAQSLVDWFTNSNVAIQGIGRINSSGAASGSSTTPYLNQISLPISAANIAAGKQVASINVSNTSAGTQVVNVFAVNLTTPATPSTSTCSPFTTAVSLGNAPGVGLSGISYQWQSSATTGGPYTNVAGGSGATTTTYTTAALTGDQYYVALITCANGGGTALSNEVYVPVTTTPAAPTVTPSSASINQGQTASFTASGSGTTGFKWYDAVTNGNLLASTAGYTTPALCSGATYYAESQNGVCPSATRTAASVLMNTNFLAFASTSIICGSGSSNLSCTVLSPAPLSYTWSTGATGTGPIAVTPVSSTAYTVSADFITCTATANVNVGVIAASAASVPTASPISQCHTGSETVSLNANVSSSNFTSSPIPYVATVVPGSGVVSLCNAGSALVAEASGNLDDGGWSGVPIPFTYNFFGNNYTSVNVGTNGVLQFGTYNSTQIAQFSFSLNPITGKAFPYTSNPANIIAAMAVDLYFASSGSIKYWTTGIAPTRAFHVFYQNAPGYTANGIQNSEVILYETTGIVEIQIGGATSTNAKNVGLQDATQTIGATAVNGVTASLGTQGYRFVPGANYTFTWSAAGGNPATATLSPNIHVVNPTISAITTPGTYVYNVAVTNPLTTCTNSSPDTFIIFPTPSAPTTIGDSTHCGPASVTFTVTTTLGSTDSIRWWTAATGGTLLTTTRSATWATPNITADTVYYAEIWNGTCASPRTATAAHYANILGGVLTVGRIPATGAICLTGSVDLTASLSGATSYTWSPNNHLSSTSGQTVTASPTANVTYTVVADFGVCTVSATGDVTYVASATIYTPTATPASQCYAAGDTVQLRSNLSASAFSVQPITYIPTVVPGSGVTTLVTGGAATPALTGGTLDDGGWGGIPLGFNFDFLGNTYNSINVGTNGLLQFGAYSSTVQQFYFPLGFPNPTYPTNIIAPMAGDMYLYTSGDIKYWVTGSAPNRAFHIFYNNVPGFTTNGLQTSEAILYETSGVVDVQVGGGTSTSYKTIGIQDITGTVGTTAPGRNAFTGTIGTEGWRFTPPSTNSFSWVASGSNPAVTTISSSSVSNPVVSAITTPGTYIYTVTATNVNTGCSATHDDTFTINRTPATPTTTGGTTTCGAYPLSFTSTGSPDSIQWYSASVGGTLVGGGSPWTTPIITGDTAYYAMVTTGFCSTPRVRTAAVYTVPPAVSISGSNDLLCAGGAISDVLTATGADPSYNYVWSNTGTASGTHNQTYTVLPTTTTTYSVTGSNTGTGCNTVATHVVQVNALPAAPTVSVSPNNVCPGSTVTLNSVAATTGYSVASIPFAPVTPVGSPTSMNLGDESVSGSIPIGFTFNYFGTNYTTLSVGSNGFLDFNTASGATYCCSGVNVTSTGYDPLIGFAWTDLDQSTGGTEDYFNLTSPNRFVVRFTNVNYYTYTAPTVTTEVILYQTGEIEIHTTSVSPHPNGFDALTVGVMNGAGLGTAAANGNASTTYSATNTAYRFAPAHPITYLWTPNGVANYMAVGQEILASATANPTSNTGKYVYTSTITDAVTTCSNSAKDTVLFTATPNSNISGPSSLCQGVAGTYNVVFSGVGPWTYSIDTVGGTISSTTSSNTVVFTLRPASTKTIRMLSLTDNSTGCSGVFSDLDTQKIVTTTNCSITWLGAADTSWSNPNNWNPILVPNSCSVDVTVPAGAPNQPSITAANIQVGNLTLGNSVRIKLNNSKTLSVCKNFSGPSGAANAYNITGSGKLILNGSVAQSYIGYGNVEEMAINNTTGGVNFANNANAHVSIYRGLHLMSGNLANSNSGAIILLSNSADTAAWLNDFTAGYTGTITGKLTAQRKVAATGTTWQHQMSSPVSGVNFYGLGQSTYGWHSSAPLVPSSNCSEDSINWTSPYSTALSWHENNVNVAVAGQPAVCATRGWYTVGGPDQWGLGIGYSVYLTSASKPALIGTANTGNIGVAGLTNSNWTVTSPEGHVFNSGWSLVGNPYPSSLDMAASPLSNGFDNQIQIFHPTGAYKGTYLPSILGGRAITIPAFQAFMVHKTATGGTSTWQFLQAERSMGVGTGYSFFKTGDANQLAVKVSGNGFNDITMVQFRDAATDAFDPEFDANKFASMHGQPTLYTLASGSNQWMGINVLGSFEKSAIVPMGFEAGTDGSFTFTVSADDIATFDASVNVYLEDKQNPNNWVNLRNNNSYTFTSKATDNKERFALHFEKTNTGITEATSSANLNIFSVENKVLVDFSKLKNVDATIQIFNILGQELSNETHHASSTYIKALENVEAAYVIVKVKMSDGSVTGSKLFITK